MSSQVISRFFGVSQSSPSAISALSAGTYNFSKTIYPGLPQTCPADASLGSLAMPNQLLNVRKNVLNGEDFEVDIAGSVTIGSGVTGGAFGLILSNNLFTCVFTANSGATLPGSGDRYSVGGQTSIVVNAEALISTAAASLSVGTFPFSLVIKVSGDGSQQIVGLSTGFSGVGPVGTQTIFSGSGIVEGTYDFSLNGAETSGAISPLSDWDSSADPSLSLSLAAVFVGSGGSFGASLTQFSVSLA